jgi:hypothetical protein
MRGQENIKMTHCIFYCRSAAEVGALAQCEISHPTFF